MTLFTGVTQTLSFLFDSIALLKLSNNSERLPLNMGTPKMETDLLAIFLL